MYIEKPGKKKIESHGWHEISGLISAGTMGKPFSVCIIKSTKARPINMCTISKQNVMPPSDGATAARSEAFKSRRDLFSDSSDERSERGFDILWMSCCNSLAVRQNMRKVLCWAKAR